jgi:hypothetical protein
MCFVIFVYCIVLYRIVLCIVVPQPPGTYPLAVNNNKKIIKKIQSSMFRHVHGFSLYHI